MKIGFNAKRRNLRAAATIAVLAYAGFVGYALSAWGAAGDGGHGGADTGCAACHGSAGGQAYVISGGQLFPTGPILPNGPTVAAGAYHDNSSITNAGGGIGGTHYSTGGAGVY